MKVVISLHSKLGDFESKELDMKRVDYEKLIEDNKDFYKKSLELPIENGYIIIPPQITKESIIKIKIVKKHAAE